MTTLNIPRQIFNIEASDGWFASIIKMRSAQWTHFEAAIEFNGGWKTFKSNTRFECMKWLVENS